MGGGGDGEFEDGLEVGLVEGREDPLDVVQEHLAVDVRLVVGRVGEAVQALAGARVAHAGVEVQLVGAFGEAGERQPVVGEGGRVEGDAVEGGRAQFGGLQLDEGVCGGACGEPDDGGGVEGLVVAGEVEGDGVVLDVEELGSELRFVARQCGHGAHAAPVGGRTPGFSLLLFARSDRLVVADDLGDDEVEELLGEGGVEFGVLGELAQAGDLAGFAARVGGGSWCLALRWPTCWVHLKRSASMWTTAASMLSMLSRRRASSAVTLSSMPAESSAAPVPVPLSRSLMFMVPENTWRRPSVPRAIGL